MQTNSTTAFSDDHIAHQCNLIHIAERYGYKNETTTIRDLAIELLQGNIEENHPITEALTKHTVTLKIFIKHLERTLKPILYGISRHWRKTQEELLRANLKGFDRGYVRQLSEVPGGAGKSMFIGAIVRAALDTIKELNLDEEIYIFTSRIAIAGQLIFETLPEEESEDRPLELGKKGDVRIWCPELDEKDIRLLAGKRGQTKEELEKNSLITVSTYQGLTGSRLEKHFKKPAFITICDESHRVTERVALLLDQLKSMVVGVSATVLGPDRDPFFFFERIDRPDLDSQEKKKNYIDYLTYHKSIAEMIKDQELKPVRWINAKMIKIDVSEAKLSSNKGIYDVFNDKSVSKILSKNPHLVADVISEAYLGTHHGLLLSGSKPVFQRRGIAFVDRIETAKKSAEACNEKLAAKIKEVHGENAYFKAGYVDGKMGEKEYDDTIAKFRSGEITLLFSAEKIGEGNDFPFVNLIIPLRVLGLGSQWKLVQNLARGARIDPQDPTGDLVVLDMVFVSEQHLLASVLGIFGRSSIISGGLLAGWHINHELEKRVFDLIMKHKSNWGEVWQKMTPEERSLFPFIEKKMLEEKARSSAGYKTIEKSVNYPMLSLSSIEFIEQDDIRLAVSLGNHDELLKYTMETLTKEGLTSIDHLRSLQSLSLRLFTKRRYGSFRDGLTMVNLNLQQSGTSLTPTKMSQFIELLRKSGFPLYRSSRPYDHLLQTPDEEQIAPPSPVFKKEDVNPNVIKRRAIVEKVVEVAKRKKAEQPVFSLEYFTTHMQELFGIEAETTSHVRDQYGKETVFITQSAIRLPEGLSFNSTIKSSTNETEAKLQAAFDLNSIIADHRKDGQILLYRGSEWYQNHLKIISLVAHEYGYSWPEYTITNRNGLFFVLATMEKHKFKIPGTVAVNKDEAVAKEHANVFLAQSLIKTLEGVRNAADLRVKDVARKGLDTICKKLNITCHGSPELVFVKKVKLYQLTITALHLKVVGFGISPKHAEEKAAKEMYRELMKVSEQSEERNN